MVKAKNKKSTKQQKPLKPGDFAIYVGSNSWKYGRNVFLEKKDARGNFDCWFFYIDSFYRSSKILGSNGIANFGICQTCYRYYIPGNS